MILNKKFDLKIAAEESFLRHIFHLILTIQLLFSCSLNTFKKKEQLQLPVAQDKVVVNKFDFEEFKKQTLIKLEQSKRDGDQQIKYISDEMFFKAMDASMRGKTNISTWLFKQLYHLHPKDDFLASKYAIELLRGGEADESIKILEAVFSNSKGKNQKIGYLLAGVYTSLSQSKQAINVYEKLVDHSENEESCIFLVQAYREEKRFDKALGTIKKCENKFEKSAALTYQRGRLEVTKGNIYKGMKFFSKALKVDPLFTRAALSLGIVHESDGDYKKAISVYEDFLNEWPDNRKILSRIVKLFFTVEDYEKVLPYLETLSSLDPDNFNLKLKLGVLYADSQNLESAINIFKEILEKIPNSDKVLYYLGTLYEQNNQDEKSIKYLSKIKPSSKLYNESNIQIARILNKKALEKDDQLAALESFITKQQKQSDELSLELNLILVNHFEVKSSYNKAIVLLESLKENKFYQEDHDYYLASLLEKDNRLNDARDVIKMLLVKNPDNPHALNFLGYTLLEKGEDLDLAFKYISKAVSLRPNDGYIRDSLGWYYYKVGEIKKAYKEIKKASSLTKNDAVITKHLAIVYQEMKRFDQAQKYFVLALENARAENERLDVLEAMEKLQRLQDSKGPVRLPASR